MLGNEDYIERLNFQASTIHLIKFLERDTPNDVLKKHLDSGRLTLECLASLSKKYSTSATNQSDEKNCNNNETPEETEIRKSNKAVYKRVLTYGWKKLNKTEKAKTLFIFKHLGIEFNNPDKDDLVLSINYVSKNIHEDCRKYFIDGDDYYYDFCDYLFDRKRDFCLSIGSCSFYPVKQIDTFRYDLYMNYLNKVYGVMETKGLIFAPTMEKIFSKDNQKYNIEEVIDSTWKFKTGDMYNCINVWQSFKCYNEKFDEDSFKTLFNQAIKINNMTNGD